MLLSYADINDGANITLATNLTNSYISNIVQMITL